MHASIERIMIDERSIAERVKDMATRLDRLYDGKKPLVVCILKGSVIFFSDLIRHMHTPLELDFMSVSSYGSGTTTGELKIKKEVSGLDY